ncbi:MAG: hypothetical protein AAGG01_06180 [Planctomycetota bacterium]
MNPISSANAATGAAMQPVASVRDHMAVSTMRMEQDQAKADGAAAAKLMAAAAEVQETGTGGRVDVTA